MATLNNYREVSLASSAELIVRLREATAAICVVGAPMAISVVPYTLSGV